MTTSPSDRAKKVCARITHFADWRDRESIIAAAITQAENEKLEEALAKIGVGFWAPKDAGLLGAGEAAWVGMKPDEMIEAIRSLKSKD